MNRDDYAMMKSREEIAKAFIDKMGNVSVNDIGLIPALMDYIQTGNKKMFDEYNDFHFIKTQGERQKKLQDSEELAKTIDAVIHKNEEYMQGYKLFAEEFRKWRYEVFANIDADCPTKDCATIGDIEKVIGKMRSSGMKNVTQRKLYILIDGKIKSAKTITLNDDNKAVIEAGTDMTFVTPAPHDQMISRHEFEVLYNMQRPRLHITNWDDDNPI